ncbi:MAG TPA: hypothetical protein V6D11_11120 [Waterburya sp.]
MNWYYSQFQSPVNGCDRLRFVTTAVELGHSPTSQFRNYQALAPKFSLLYRCAFYHRYPISSSIFNFPNFSRRL